MENSTGTSNVWTAAVLTSVTSPGEGAVRQSLDVKSVDGGARSKEILEQGFRP